MIGIGVGIVPGDTFKVGTGDDTDPVDVGLVVDALPGDAGPGVGSGEGTEFMVGTGDNIEVG